MKKVSIIVPIYNVEQYIQECVESLINQTYYDLEIILINDGSTDSSGELCDEFSEKDNRIRVVHQKNAGAANAKNKGLDMAIGEYITFIDSDDVVEVNWIQMMVQEMESEDVEIVECKMDLLLKNRVEAVNDYYDDKKIFTSEEYLAQYLNRWTSSLFWNKLFKRELTKNIRFKKERRCIDDEFYTYKVISNAKKISRIDDVLYHYRQRKSSVVRTKSNQFQITDDALEVLIERYEWIKARYPMLRRIYLNHDMDFLLYYSKQGFFNKKLIKKYRKIAYYYLSENMKMRFTKISLINEMYLLFCKPKDNSNMVCIETIAEDCFD